MKLATFCAVLLAAGVALAGAQQVPMATVAGNTLAKDLTSRTGASTVVSNQVQGAVQQGSTFDQIGALARTRDVGRASASTRSAIGSQSAQAAVQAAVRGNNAAAGVAQAAGATAVSAQGRGFQASQGARQQQASSAASAAVQQAVSGRSTAAQAAQSAQSAAQATQVRTSFTPATTGRKLML